MCARTRILHERRRAELASRGEKDAALRVRVYTHGGVEHAGLDVRARDRIVSRSLSRSLQDKDGAEGGLFGRVTPPGSMRVDDDDTHARAHRSRERERERASERKK